MSGRLLSIDNYLKGADQVQLIEMFPSSQKTFTYDYGANVSSYSFKIDYQTIVVDTLTYDRTTGQPNFTDSSVIGYFPTVTTHTSNTYINTSQAGTGVVNITIPSDRYTGNITPDARTNVAITVASVEWTTGDTPPQIDLHRWAIVERWEPEVQPGDPTQETSAQGGFTSLT